MNTVVSLCQFVLLLSLLSLAYAVKAEPKGECLPIGHSDDTTLFHCASMQELTSCQDENDNCMNWAQQGECRKNAAYMIFNCRKSCETCVSLHHGTTQRCHSLEEFKGVMQLLVETQQYIYDVISLQANLFQSCVSRSPNCASFALQGECTSNPSWMAEHCPAVCRLCK